MGRRRPLATSLQQAATSSIQNEGRRFKRAPRRTPKQCGQSQERGRGSDFCSKTLIFLRKKHGSEKAAGDVFEPSSEVVNPKRRSRLQKKHPVEYQSSAAYPKNVPADAHFTPNR